MSAPPIEGSPADSSHRTSTSSRELGPAAAAIGLALGLGSAAVSLVVHAGSDPSRCPERSEPRGPRCCGEGQRSEHGRCIGVAQSCPAHLDLTPAGCVPRNRRITLAGGKLDDGSTDWEATGHARAEFRVVAPFAIDAYEVTRARWLECTEARACSPLVDPGEPGEPVRSITARELEEFCAFAGGRLPTSSELAFASAGETGQRYPWGPTGAVCRRAAWGLERGPCAEGAIGPEIAGFRPAGATPEGVHDLSGNVSEWVRLDPPARGFAAHGGSFRSTAAAELRSWSHEPADEHERAADRGGRCAYDVH